MKKNIKILDYGIGNLLSIYQAFERFDINLSFAKNANDLKKADQLILPGVGAFSKAMSKLEDLELIEPINDFARSGKNILGICLGMQMLFEKSYEFGEYTGLGLIKGSVNRIKYQEGYKVPNISWSSLNVHYPDHKIFKNLKEGDSFYFVHSFTPRPLEKKDNIASCKYGNEDLCAIAGYENILGTQFHPEKSGERGLSLIETWLDG